MKRLILFLSVISILTLMNTPYSEARRFTSSPNITAEITGPAQVTDQDGVATITGSAYGPDFVEYDLIFKKANSNEPWKNVILPNYQTVDDGVLGRLELRGLDPDTYSIRLRVFDIQSGVTNITQNLEVTQNTDDIDIAITKKEEQITTDPSAQEFSSTSGNRIVWRDDRNGNSDIFMYDIATGQETPVITNPSQQTALSISGNRIIWRDDRNGNYDIFMYDITTQQEIPITTNLSNQYIPSISGNRIVWHDDRNGNYDIFMYDITTGQETPIITNPLGQFTPSIHGDRIVWLDDRNAHLEIYMYDIATGQETRITTNSSIKFNPSIFGNRIVWEDHRNFNWDIYMFDIGTQQEIQITTNSSNQNHPSIHGDRIVWSDERNGNPDIYMYYIGTQEEIPITTDPAIQDNPSIHDDRIVWHDERNGNWDIYSYTMLFEPEVPLTTDPHAQWFSHISGHNAVWTNEVYENNTVTYSIHSYNFETGETVQQTSNQSTYLVSQDMSGDLVLVQDGSATNESYSLLNLLNDSYEPLSLLPGDKDHMSLFRTRITWVENDDIYTMDLTNNQVDQITADPDVQKNPVTNGDVIVYIDYTDDPQWGDLKVYDLVTHTTQLLSNSKFCNINSPNFTCQKLSISGNFLATNVIITNPGGLTISKAVVFNVVTGERTTWIENSLVSQAYVNIDNNLVTWMESDNGTKVIVHDLRDNSKHEASSSSASPFLHLDLSGKRIIWDDDRDFDPANLIFDMNVYAVQVIPE